MRPAVGVLQVRAPVQSPVRVGILGLGSIGRLHLRALAACQGASVVAVCRRTMGPRPGSGIDVHSDYVELLDRADVDVVVITTPSGDHAEQIRAALDHGKHVVVEKPMTIAPHEARSLQQQAHDSGLLLAPISQRRLEPQMIQLKELLDRGALGRPVLGEALVRWHRTDEYYSAVDWRGTVEKDGGVLLNQALHTVDLLCWLLGPCPTVVGLTATLTHDIAAEDSAVAALQFSSGALGVLAVTTSAHPGVPEELNVFFDKGYVRTRGSAIVDWTFEDVPWAGRTQTQTASGASNPLAIGIDGHRAQWDDIISALTGGRDPTVTAASAIETLDIIEKVRRKHDR